jgi:predicted nucleic acid-binding protein
VRRAVESLDSEDLFLSVISVGEIAKGVALLREAKKRDELRGWMHSLEHDYADRILGVDLETSHLWGELSAEAQKSGKIVPASDGLIAATARVHGLHVMTRNTEHFRVAGVLLINPWVS